jgi:hypothetical protein
VDEAAAEEPKKTRKSRGPRKRTAFGRESLVLKKLDVPENGYPPETTIEDFDCHKHSLPQHTDFQDPIDYHRFLLDTLAPQITQLATAAIEKMSKIGDAKARQDVNAVGGSIEATASMIKELGADASPEAKEAMLADLAAMMASVQASMQG